MGELMNKKPIELLYRWDGKSWARWNKYKTYESAMQGFHDIQKDLKRQLINSFGVMKIRDVRTGAESIVG